MLGGTLFPGHMGLARLEGGAGLAAAGLDVGRGLHKAISSDDLGEATEGAGAGDRLDLRPDDGRRAVGAVGDFFGGEPFWAKQLRAMQEQKALKRMPTR